MEPSCDDDLGFLFFLFDLLFFFSLSHMCFASYFFFFFFFFLCLFFSVVQLCFQVPAVESTREEKIRLHYENQLKIRDAQISTADAVATRLHEKYRAAVTKLQSLMHSTRRHEKSLVDGRERVERAKDELRTTREAMASQSAMLSSRVMELDEQLRAAEEMVDRLQNNDVRCVHCHGWNRISRIVGKPGESIRPCIHCQKNTGFRSLED